MIAIVLVARKTRGAILISIVVTTVFAVILNAIVDVTAQIAPAKVHTSALGRRESRTYEEVINGGPYSFLSAPGLWIGFVFAALFLALAVRLRRNRAPI